MQQLSVAAVNRCVVRNGGAKAANQHVAGLRTGCADTVKSRRLQIIQIEIVTMPPPVVVPVKIRHINPRQMIGITEQRVTVKNPMFKLSSGQVWHTAEFMYRRRIPATTAGHFEPAACDPHRSDTAGRQDGCEPAPQYPPAFQPSASPPAPYGNNPPARQKYSHRGDTVLPPVFSPRSRTTPQAHTVGRAPEYPVLS